MYLIIFLFWLIIYNISNILEIIKDLISCFQKKSILKTVHRIHPLFLKFNRGNNLGIYEMYVLNREITKYKDAGGDISYFTSGFGSENIIFN